MHSDRQRGSSAWKSIVITRSLISAAGRLRAHSAATAAPVDVPAKFWMFWRTPRASSSSSAPR